MPKKTETTKYQFDTQYHVIPTVIDSSFLDLVTSDIIGPSSSHTAGVMRIGRKIREQVPEFHSAKIVLYNSLADTGDAHMTKSALIAGLLGWMENDPRIPFSFRYAENGQFKFKWVHKRDENMHPNTVVVEVYNSKKHVFRGTSIGGGRYKLEPVPEA